MLKRICLLLGYWLAASIAAYRFVGNGDGSLVPFIALASWPGFAIALINQLLKLTESGLVFYTVPVGLILFITYYLGLIMLTSKLSAGRKAGTCLIPGVIHLSGGLALAVISGKQRVLPQGNLGIEALNSDAHWFIASYIVTLAIVLLWLTIDWRLAKGAHKSLKQPFNNESGSERTTTSSP